MHQFLSLPDWLPGWVPAVVVVFAALWALVFLVMPFSVFGVKSRLELIEARLDEIQNEIRHVALRLPPGGGPGVDYDDPYPSRMQERAPERLMTRPPIPPARHELYAPEDAAPRAPIAQSEPRLASRDPRTVAAAAAAAPPVPPPDVQPIAAREPALEDRPPPPLNGRPSRRSEPLSRPAARAEPRLDWRR